MKKVILRALPLCLLGISLLTLLQTVGRTASDYTIVRIEGLGGKTTDSDMTSAINNKGQVTGEADTAKLGADGTPLSHVFLYSDGKTSDLGVPTGYSSSSGTAINSEGEIVGRATGPQNKQCAILYRHGKLVDLNTLLEPGSGWQLQSATGINDAEQVIGTGKHLGKLRAFLMDGSQITDLGTLPGYDASEVGRINNAGEIVGDLKGAGQNRPAFLWQGGKMTLLEPIAGYTIMLPTGINASGDIIGGMGKSTSTMEPFLYHAGKVEKLMLGDGRNIPTAIASDGSIIGLTMGFPFSVFLYTGEKRMDINRLLPADAPWTLEMVTGINDQGQIVGEGQYKGKDNQMFLMTPSAK